MIILPTIRFHQHLGLLQTRKRLGVEQLIPEPAVERFDIRILPRAARRDVQRRGHLGPRLPPVGLWPCVPG